MNVLITFKPNSKQDNFEGSRLRKTIKGALEMVDVPYCTSVMEDYDVIHLLSPDDANKENDAIEKSVPVVVSALMAENDPNASFLDFRYKDGKILNILSGRSLRFLNKASLVIVPCQSAVDILKEEGVKTDIEILSPGVNLSRFDFSRDDEKELFFRYFREERSKKLVIGNGDYDNIEGINAFIEASRKCPDAIFYFFGQAATMVGVNHAIRTLIKKAPDNCHFKPVVPDDIYRSALLNASVFLLPSYKYSGIVSILEAMAAKCQLIVREQAVFPGFVQDGKTGYIAKFSETLSSLTKDYLEGKLRPTYPEAYNAVKEHTLEKIGERLKNIYQKEINANNQLGGYGR